MPKHYVLDTSAIFTYTKDEAGSDILEDIFDSAKRRKSLIYLSFITLTELYYVSWQEKGEEIARELMVLVESLPMERVDSTGPLALLAGRIKANYRLSVADAFIGATAIHKQAVLVHKDPEFEALAHVLVEIADRP